MKIDWGRQMHDGWRRSLGVFCIVFAVALAGFSYASDRHVAPTEVATSVLATNAPSSVQTELASASPTPSSESSSPQSGKIHLSTASQKDLESLPKIGPAKATAIIEYREKSGFKSVNDLDKVKGIGPATLELLRPLVEL